MQTIDVICPVFREEDVIELFHDRLSAALEPLSKRYDFHVIYVLDPSPDGTESLLAGIAARDPRVDVLVMSRRFGHQAALIAGMDRSRGDAAIMLDSDLQHPPELIDTLLAHWEDGAEVVQAIRQDGAETGPFKRWASRWFYRLFAKVGAVDLPAGSSDCRLLSERVIEVFRAQLLEQNPFLRGLVNWVGFKAVNVPFQPVPRTRGHSKYPTSTLMNFALNGICSFSKLPLRFCIGLGLTVAALSFVGGLLQIVIYMFESTAVPGWASLIAALCFLGGVQLFFLGVIGEYVSLIFDEVKSRPRYLIDRQYKAGGFARREDAERTEALAATGAETPVGRGSVLSR